MTVKKISCCDPRNWETDACSLPKVRHAIFLESVTKTLLYGIPAQGSGLSSPSIEWGVSSPPPRIFIKLEAKWLDLSLSETQNQCRPTFI